MSTLNSRDREFVAIGAALASNCAPCVEYHIAESRRIGLSDAEIAAAIEVADQIKRVSASKVLEAASSALGGAQVAAPPDGGCSPAVMTGDGRSCCS